MNLPKEILEIGLVDPEALSLAAEVGGHNSRLHEGVPSEAEHVAEEAHARDIAFLTHAAQRGKLSVAEHHLVSAKHASVLVVRRDL